MLMYGIHELILHGMVLILILLLLTQERLLISKIATGAIKLY